ncbi:MAG TPA: 2OG-Fe(II) oxygenase [Stellaceae bacterium]|jgi:peroxiredoxin|nr:2OG-Fe(II) oxygenase [Stellaceae bacterium]
MAAMDDKGKQAAIRLGDPVPWFEAGTVTGGSVALHVDAGRWAVLSFLGSLAEQDAAANLAALLREAALFEEDHIVFYGILAAPPTADALAQLAAISGPAIAFIADYDGSVARRYGVCETPHSVILDPLQRAIAAIGRDHPTGHAEAVGRVLRGLPPVDESAGVPLWAPALVVPRVLDFELCDFLIRLYDAMGGEESGFLLDRGGKTATVVDHRLKRRRDLLIVDPALRRTMQDQIRRRLVPAIEQFFGFSATRMDRCLVSCYDATEGGYFFRHRDNVNAGAEHRRFAVSINLNGDYEGCDLIFPEFGRRLYRAPVGGAVVFSCAMLHQVTPVTRGRRFAFVPFLYGETEAALRERNNARLAAGEKLYVEGSDRLFPLAAE